MLLLVPDEEMQMLCLTTFTIVPLSPLLFLLPLRSSQPTPFFMCHSLPDCFRRSFPLPVANGVRPLGAYLLCAPPLALGIDILSQNRSVDWVFLPDGFKFFGARELWQCACVMDGAAIRA